jgi:hypothetical protein
MRLARTPNMPKRTTTQINTSNQFVTFTTSISALPKPKRNLEDLEKMIRKS